MPIFYFPRQDWMVGEGGEGVVVFSFGQEGELSKILYDVGGSEKILPF